jgi:hypothetical protein
MIDKARDRTWVLEQIDRLMQPGIKIHPCDVNWCVQTRDRFYADEAKQPWAGIADRVRRLLIKAGLLKSTRQWAKRAAPRPADYHPEAMAPAALQGPTKPTPMPAWLANGTAAPIPKRPAYRSVRP